ncbi:MAG: RidA family protein, partial [Brevibacterium aurantiacum]|nr:RidA family protein [Brevibacterium aurantiacum]
MIRRIETAPGLAPSIGPYSQAVVANGFVFTTGQVPFAADGITPEAFEDQVRTCLGNLRSVLETAGSGIAQVGSVSLPSCHSTMERLIDSPSPLPPLRRARLSS